MKFRYVMTTAAAAALIFVGAGGAVAGEIRPHIGSTGCTSSDYVHQYTKYHGTICYTNVGYDNLTTSGFWTTKITFGSNTGIIQYYSTDGNYGSIAFVPHSTFDVSQYPDDFPGGVVSLVGLTITSTTP